MSGLDQITIQCPYCWESVEILVDPSVDHQCYIEDCAVCCRPITLDVGIRGGAIMVEPRREDD